MLDTNRHPTRATFADYVTTLPMWDRELLVHAMEKPLATPFYQLLLQKDSTLLVVSDGGASTAIKIKRAISMQCSC
jgi:hypothetical protein